MKRTKLADRQLPDYTRGEEIFNFVSHTVGGVFAVVALVMCVAFAAYHANVWGIVSGAIYGVTMVLLYTVSSVYHGITPILAKKVFQVIDHCTIFLLIAGTYTPITLVGFRKISPLFGWGVFGIIWFFAILGIVLTAIDWKKYSVFAMICYLGMGWCAVLFVKHIIDLVGFLGTMFLVIGGVSYTVGAVLYALGRKHRYFHSIFHLFVVAGSVMHFAMILVCIMPLK